MSSVTINSPTGFDTGRFWITDFSRSSGETFAGLTSTTGNILTPTQSQTYSDFTFTSDGLTYHYYGTWRIDATQSVVAGSISASGVYDRVAVYSGATLIAEQTVQPLAVDFGTVAGAGVLGLLGNLLAGVVSLLLGDPNSSASIANLHTTATPNLPQLAYSDGVSAIGNAGADTLRGGDAADTIGGGAGADVLIGLGGDDRYVVDNAGDAVVEAANGGQDIVYASVDHALAAHVEHLVLTGSAIHGTGNDLANVIDASTFQGAIDNVLVGGGGNDTMIGGLGNDSYEVREAGDVVVEAANGGRDTVYTSVDYALSAHVEDLFLGAGAVFGTGNDLDNVIDAATYGGTTANVLRGGAGNDIMIGGLGDDIYEVRDAGDVVVERLNEGIDTVYASIDHTLAANVENLVLGGSATVGIGNALGNIIDAATYGGSIAHTLIGGAGNDTMIGGLGDDSFEVRDAGDVVVEAAGGGRDTVYAGIDYTLAANVENLVVGASAVRGTGNALDNVIDAASYGGATNNVLDGGAGNDTLFGGEGRDTFVFTGDFGFDRVADFRVGDDLIQVSRSQFAGFAAVQAAGHQVGADTVIGLDATHAIQLTNVTLAELTALDFVFV